MHLKFGGEAVSQHRPPEQAPKWWWLSHLDGNPFPFPAPSSLGPLSSFSPPPCPCPCPLTHSTFPSSFRSPPCLSPRGPLVSPSPRVEATFNSNWDPPRNSTGPQKEIPSVPRGREKLWPSPVPAPRTGVGEGRARRPPQWSCRAAASGPPRALPVSGPAQPHG